MEQPCAKVSCTVHYTTGRPFDDDHDDCGGDYHDCLEAHSHLDKISPWWVFVRRNNGGNLSVSRRAADHMCRRAVYQLPAPSTATAAEKQIFK